MRIEGSDVLQLQLKHGKIQERKKKNVVVHWKVRRRSILARTHKRSATAQKVKSVLDTNFKTIRYKNIT